MNTRRLVHPNCRKRTASEAAGRQDSLGPWGAEGTHDDRQRHPCHRFSNRPISTVSAAPLTLFFRVLRMGGLGTRQRPALQQIHSGPDRGGCADASEGEPGRAASVLAFLEHRFFQECRRAEDLLGGESFILNCWLLSDERQ
jgi:hypothetical protein